MSPGGSLAIRPLTNRDIADAARVGLAAYGSSIGQYLHEDDTRKIIENREFDKFLQTKYKLVDAAWLGRSLAGWGGREDGDNYISDLWVAPEFQNRGIGARLLRELESRIRFLGYRDAQLETSVPNVNAIRFYERYGYVQCWRGMKFTSGLGREIEKIRLKKALVDDIG